MDVATKLRKQIRKQKRKQKVVIDTVIDVVISEVDVRTVKMNEYLCNGDIKCITYSIFHVTTGIKITASIYEYSSYT